MLTKDHILSHEPVGAPEPLVPSAPKSTTALAQGTIPQGERNSELFKLGCSLQSKGVPDFAIRDALLQANQERCVLPLDVQEVEGILKGVLKYPKAAVSQAASEKTAIKQNIHVVIGEALINDHSMKFIDDIPAIWDGFRYQTGWKPIRQYMNAINYGIKEKDRKEVQSWLELEAPDEEMGDPKYIAFANGVLDIETMELIRNTTALNIINVIPHRWNPDARSALLEDCLNSWACGDQDVRLNIEEVIGLSMYSGRNIAACPVLIGEGANGKSTFLKFLRELLGEENVSSMDLAALSGRFQTAALVGKLANIGDDISSEFLNKDKASVFKKIVSGDPIQVEEKYGTPFSFRPYCTLIFSCNDFPRIGDNTYGMYRRLIPVPFSADFNVQSGSCDINLESRLATDEAYEAAIVLGVNALKGCLAGKSMSANRYQEGLREELRYDNSPVFQFYCEVLGYGSSEQKDLVGQAVSKVYKDYEDFCMDNGYKPKGSAQFSKEMQKVFGIGSSKRTINGHQQACFVKRDGRTSSSYS